MLTIEPAPCSIMSGPIARPRWNTPVRFTAMTAFHSSSVIFCSRLSRVIPALLTRTSMRPSSVWIRSTATCTAAASVTSRDTGFTDPCFAVTSSKPSNPTSSA